MVSKGLWLWDLLLHTGGSQVGVPGEERGETNRDALSPLVTECIPPGGKQGRDEQQGARLGSVFATTIKMEFKSQTCSKL